MSDVLKNAAAVDPPAPPPTEPAPTVTHFQQEASQVSAKIIEARALITGLQSPHPSTIGFVHSHQIPPAFIATAVTVVEATPELQGLNKLDIEKVRGRLQFNEAFRPIADQLRAFVKDLDFTMDAGTAESSAAALQVYAIAKGVARDPSSAALVAHVSNLKRDLGRSRPKPRAKVPVAKPAASPQEVNLKKAA